MRGGPRYVFQLYYVTYWEFRLVLLPGDRGRVPWDQNPLPRNATPGTGEPSEAIRAAARVVARVRPRGAGSGAGAGARGGWPNGTGERGRRGRGVPGEVCTCSARPRRPVSPSAPGRSLEAA